MSPYQHVIPSVAVPVVLLLAIATPAQAYLDPGTGSMVLQLILGGVAGAMVVLKLYWTRLKSLFGFSSETPSATSDEVDEPHGK